MKKILATFSALLLLFPVAASAHQHASFRIGGATYDFVIGSLNEPIAVDDRTGVELRITRAAMHGMAMHEDGHDHEESEGVTGLEETLQVELIAGEQRKVLELSPAFNDPGAYRAIFYPTVATTLSYRVFGTVGGTPFDYTFTCTPAGHERASEDTSEVPVSDGVVRTLLGGGYGCPVPKAELGFPEASSDLVSLSSETSMAQTLSYAALALSVVAAGLALWRRRQ